MHLTEATMASKSLKDLLFIHVLPFIFPNENQNLGDRNTIATSRANIGM